MSTFKPIDVYLIFGQSNAVGCTLISTLPEDFTEEYFDDALLYQEGNFCPDYYGKLKKGVGIGMGNNATNMGIEYGISKVLSGRGEFALIRYALGGSNLFFDWKPLYKCSDTPQFIGQPGYSYACAMKTVANGISALVRNGYSPQIRALVWMQGESDADKSQEIADEYFNNLTDLVASIRTQLMNRELPVVIGEIATHSPQCNWSDAVRSCQRRYCESDEKAHLVSTVNIPIGHDGLHFDGKSVVELGISFGEKLKEITAYSQMK